jgi:hypothetical protein
MHWVRLVVGILCGFLGLVWIGQGLNFIPGSFMTGQLQWAIIGLVLVAVAVWLIWGAVKRWSGTPAGS